MAKKESNPLIHCEACGEEYSATYRRCPFCGTRGNREQNAAQDDDNVLEGGYGFREINREASAGRREPGRETGTEESRSSANRGGKRLAGASTAATSRSTGTNTSRSGSGSRGTSTAGTTRSGGSRGSGSVPQGRSAATYKRAPQPKRSAFLEFWDRVGVSPVRVIGFVFTLVIIIAVFLIVTKLVLPAIGRGSVDTPDNEKPDVSQSQPADPSPSSSSTTKPKDEEPEPTNTIPADQTAVDFTINYTEFTISARWPNPVKIEVTLLPAGSKGTVTFTSSNPDAIGVTEDGTVWAVGKGSATITATLPGAEPKTCKVISTVAGGIPPTNADSDPAPSASASTAPSASASTAPSGDLKLSIAEFTMSDKYPNPVTIKVTGASGTVTWTSSNSAVASVDQNGKVSRVGDGKCTITATDAAGNSATCVVRCS